MNLHRDFVFNLSAKVPLNGATSNASPDAPEWSMEESMKRRHHTPEQVIRKLACGCRKRHPAPLIWDYLHLTR